MSGGAGRFGGVLAFHVLEIQRFDFSPRPGGPAQKLQTGFNTRIEVKTPHFDFVAEFLPAVVINQLLEDCLKCQAVQRVFPTGKTSGCCEGSGDRLR